MKSRNKLTEQAGKVSVWFNVSFVPENRLAGWYDEDYSESSTFDPHNIMGSLSGSYAGSFKQQVSAAAHKLGVNPQWTFCFLIYDVSTLMLPGYQLSEKDKALKGVNADEGAIFVGVFDYKKQAGK